MVSAREAVGSRQHYVIDKVVETVDVFDVCHLRGSIETVD
jgi:hypothetical protein